jgi:predicted flap endonuclease-1-like 5' DNA nuclease
MPRREETAMADKTISEIIKLRDAARKRMTEAMKLAAGGGRVDPALAAKELDRVIAAQDQRLEATRAAMANSVTRFENEVRLRETRIAELRELRKQLGDDGGKTAPPVRLRDVKGIGPVAEERLHEGGITSVKVFAETPPARIAELLERNADVAKEFIREAKRLLKT